MSISTLFPYNNNNWLRAYVSKGLILPDSWMGISEYVFANNKKLFENGILALEEGKTSLSELLRITEE